MQQYNVALHYLNLPAEVLGDDVFSKEMHVAFDEGIEELCVGRETSCDKSALRRICMGLGDPSQHTEVCNPPSGCPRSGHGGAELLGLQLRFRGLHLKEVDQAGAGGCESAGAVTGRQQAVFVPQRPGVNGVGFCLQGEDVLEGRGGTGSAVGVPHGEGDGAGTGLPRAPAAGQVFAHGPLEVPHEERVDDGVHGAVAVPQPGEHVEEAGRDTAADSLAGGTQQGLAASPTSAPIQSGFPGTPTFSFRRNPSKPLQRVFPSCCSLGKSHLWSQRLSSKTCSHLRSNPARFKVKSF